MKKSIIFAVSLLIATLGIAQVDNTKSKKILNKASEKMQSYKDVAFEFTYSMENNVNDTANKKSGRAYMKGEKYRIEIDNQIIMSDGKTSWTYLPDVKEVQVAKATDNPQNNPLKLLKEWGKNYRSKYIRTEIISGHTIDIIDLIPKEGKSYFKVRLRIKQSNKQLVSSTIYDKNSTTYTYIINEFKTNTGISDNKFKFNKSEHPEVEVLDLR